MDDIKLSRIPLLFIAFVSVALLGGCTNLSAVRSFADETKKLSSAFDPMLSGSLTSCIEKYERKKLITSMSFDPETVEKAAKELCEPISEANKVMSDLNLLLEQYAETLSSLADDKLTSYKPQLDGLAASLAKVKKPGSRETLVNADKIGAVSALTEFLSRAATLHLQKNAIRDLLNHEVAIVTVTNTLRDYANLNYRAWLKDEQRENGVLEKSLGLSSRSEPLASNYLKSKLFMENKQILEREKTVDFFIRSIDQFQVANSEIRKNFDRLDDKELLSRIVTFAGEVSKLHKQVVSAF
jgi:hypothetical protein